MSDTSKMIVTGVACLALGAVAGSYLPMGNLTGSGVNTDKVKTIIADYIADNPEKIIESLQAMQQKSASEQQAQAQNAVKDNMAALLNDTNSPTAGTGTSGITLVEFFDYNCGYCRRMEKTMHKIMQAHPDIKIIFKEFPIFSEDSHSHRAAQAALAIYYLSPKRYVDFHSMLMQHKGDYTQQELNDYAGQVQVNLDDFQKEMNSKRVAQEIQKVNELASKLGVQGTPAIVIGDELIPGAMPFNEVDKRIKALKDKK